MSKNVAEKLKLTDAVESLQVKTDPMLAEVLSSIKSTIQNNLKSGLGGAMGASPDGSIHNDVSQSHEGLKTTSTRTPLDHSTDVVISSHKHADLPNSPIMQKKSESDSVKGKTNSVSHSVPGHGKTADIYYLTQLIEDDGSITTLRPIEMKPTQALPEASEVDNQESIESSPSNETGNSEQGPHGENSISEQSQKTEDAQGQAQLHQDPLSIDTQTNIDSQFIKQEAAMTNAPNNDFDIASTETLAESAAALSSLKDMARRIQETGPTSDRSQGVSPESAGQYTVENLMREMLRPLLKEWLDAHLPSLVKWLVTEQIEKMLQEQLGVSPKRSEPQQVPEEAATASETDMAMQDQGSHETMDESQAQESNQIDFDAIDEVQADASENQPQAAAAK